MKGFSGFGNSPAKQDRRLKPEVEQAYSDTILSGMRRRPGYDNLDQKGKKKIKEARKRLDGYVATEKEMNRSIYNLARSRGL